MLLAGATVFTSCKKDEETTTAPSISFANNVKTFEIDFATMADPYTVTIIPTVTAEGEINTFTVKKKNALGASSTVTVTGDFAGKTTFTETFNIQFASTEEFPIQVIFTVTDKEDRSQEEIFTVTKKTAVVTNPIYTHTGVSLTSAYSAPTAAEYVAALTGTTYNHTAAGTATFGFVSGGATNGSCIFTSGFDFTLSSVPSPWSNVSFVVATTLTAAQFDAVTNEPELLAVMPASVTGIKVNTLQDGAANAGVNVIAFIDGSGKKGLVKLPASMDNTAGQVISISIKVQQ